MTGASLRTTREWEPFLRRYFKDLRLTERLLLDRGLKEDAAMLRAGADARQAAALRLPNWLSPDTPIGSQATLLRTGGTKALRRSPDGHISTLTERDWLRVKRGPPVQLFLAGKAARLLYALQKYINRLYLAAGFLPIVPSHLIRTDLLEEGLDQSNNSPLRLCNQGEEERFSQCLLGQCLYSYVALFARRALGPSTAFPVQLFSTGSSYRRYAHSGHDCGLVNSPQSVRSTAFVLSTCAQRTRRTLDQLTRGAELAAEELQIPFSVYQQPSRCLTMAESARLTFAHDHLGSDCDFAAISSYDDYLSHKFQFTTDQQQPLHCLYMEVNLYRLLAAVVEYYWSKSDCNRLPAVLRAYYD